MLTGSPHIKHTFFEVLWLSVLLCLFILSAVNARALFPQQTALLINKNDQNSKALGNQYRAWRGIPVENVFYVDVPNMALSAHATLSSELFDQYILGPVIKEISDRKLDKTILIWAFSSGFPVKVQAETAVSLQGYTLVKGQLPEAQWIRQGKAVTPLYLGFEGQGGEMNVRPPIPFRAWHLAQGTNMPLPSMMLSFQGARGLTQAEALRHLSQGVSADGQNFKGSIFFETNKDIRSRARFFQFEPAVHALNSMGLSARIIEERPQRHNGILGILSGRPTVFPKQLGTYHPGAFADHLTSFAAVFDQYHQTKCTEWLRAGATATAGTVVEPMAIWTKFPAARFFELYASGLTMIEALYGATACPFQTLLLGDPLSAPYQKRVPIIIVDMEGGKAQGLKTYQAHILSGMNVDEYVWQFFLDGVPLGSPKESNELVIDTEKHTDGYHRLDVLAIHRSNALIQGVATLKLQIDNHNQFVKAHGPETKIPFFRPVQFEIVAETNAIKVGVQVQGNVQAIKSGHKGVFDLQPEEWGVGPVEWKAFSIYANGDKVYSEPRTVVTEVENQAPVIQDIITGDEFLNVSVEDPENDSITLECWNSANEQSVSVHGLVHHKRLQVIRPSIEKKSWVALIDKNTESPYRGVLADSYEHRKGTGLASGRRIGLIYDYKDPQNFMFVGYGGIRTPAWVQEHVKEGVWERIQSRGAPVFKGQKYQMELIQDGSNLDFAVNGKKMMNLTYLDNINPLGVLTHTNANLETVRFLCAEYTGREASEIPVRAGCEFHLIRVKDAFGATSWSRSFD